jgi:F0F1-type ATP synthase alpha subunit
MDKPMLKTLIGKHIQAQTKMNIAPNRHSQISQSLFRLSLKNTRILIKRNMNINQIVTGTCNQKTITPVGREQRRMLQHPTVSPHRKAAKHENSKAAK